MNTKLKRLLFFAILVTVAFIVVACSPSDSFPSNEAVYLKNLYVYDGATWNKITTNGGGGAITNATLTNLNGFLTGNGANVGSQSVVTETQGGTNQTTYTKGDTLYASNANTLSKLPGNTTSAQKFLSQTGDGVNSAAPSWQTIPSQGTLTYYLTPTGSDLTNGSAIVNTDKKMLSTPYGVKTAIDIANDSNADVVLQTFATDAGIPNLSYIPAGAYEFHIHAYKLSGSRSVTLYGIFREVQSNGTNIGTIGTVTESTVALSGSELEYRLFMDVANTYTMASSASRIVLDVHAVFGLGNNTTVRMYVGGTADSHIALPSATVDATNFVPYNGATSDVNLGAKSLITASVTDSGLTSGKLTKATTGGLLIDALAGTDYMSPSSQTIFSGYLSISTYMPSNANLRPVGLVALVDTANGVTNGDWVGTASVYVQSDAASSGTHIIDTVHHLFTADMKGLAINTSSVVGGVTNAGVAVITNVNSASDITIGTVSGSAFASSYYYWIRHAEYIIPKTGNYLISVNLTYYPASSAKIYDARLLYGNIGDSTTTALIATTNSNGTAGLSMGTTTIRHFTSGQYLCAAAVTTDIDGVSAVYGSEIYSYWSAIFVSD